MDPSSINLFSNEIEFISKEFLKIPITTTSLLNTLIGKDIELVKYNEDGKISFSTIGKLISNINQSRENNRFLFFGIGSAIFLILHSVLLGITYEIDLYKFFRRFVLLGFIIFEVIAQALLVLKILKIKNKINDFINQRILFLKILLVSILILVAVVSAPILNSTEFTYFKHALEWNYFMGVVFFYLLSFFFWKAE